MFSENILNMKNGIQIAVRYLCIVAMQYVGKKEQVISNVKGQIIKKKLSFLQICWEDTA